MEIEVYSKDIKGVERRSPLLFAFLRGVEDVEVKLVPWDGYQKSLPKSRRVLVEIPWLRSTKTFRGKILSCQRRGHLGFFRDCHACPGFDRACVGNPHEAEQLLKALDYFLLVRHLALVQKHSHRKRRRRTLPHPPICATHPAS